MRRQTTRRKMLWQLGGGLGGIALAQLLGEQGLCGETGRPEFNGGLHHRARAKRVVQLFMNGGASPMDTFDYKPALARLHGQKVDFGIKSAVTSPVGTVMKSPFAFKQHGQCGRWVSSVFPHVAKCVDDMAFLMAMTTKTNVHGPASYMQNTGFLSPGFPCLGAWSSYALGSLSDNMPTFVVLPDQRGLPYNNAGNFSAAFLPAAHQGMVIKPNDPIPVANLRPPKFAKEITAESEAGALALLDRINRDHARLRPGDSRLEARISSYELAAKMQITAPEVLDITGETKTVRKQYGIDNKLTARFGRNCLTARRMLERGTRFVQLWSGAGGASNNWDNHTNIPKELPSIASSVDQPIAALLQDLKQRGMFEDTLVVWTTEFGRMPFTQGATGRDHNGGTFVTWLAGAGIKGGATYGLSDEFSYKSVDEKTYCYDLHATILHLLGIDHKRLSFRHNGIDRRLTDVHGHVIRKILA